MSVGVFVAVLFLVVTPAMAQSGGAQATPPPGPVLVFETEKGTFEIETYPSIAPKTVNHIVGLVQKRFYNGLRIHRVIQDFVVQLGDPQTREMAKKDLWGTGGSGKPIGVAEISKNVRHSIGMVSMAHKGNPTGVDSQFFIVIGPASHLDGEYPIWGKVSSGMDVVNTLEVLDRVITATVKGAK